MSSAPQQGGGDGGKRAALVAVNDLNYVLPPDMSVSVNRTHTNHYFQQNEYTNNQRAICILNSGANYIDMRQSTLEFGVKLTEAGLNGAITDLEGYLGINGSALNLIESVTISSRSGDELARINQADLLHYATIGYTNNSNWLETVGQAMGYGQSCLPERHDRSTTHFSIPLYCLTELFAYGRLFPPMLASGLRISISWTTPDQAFVVRDAKGLVQPASPSAFSAFTITNPYVSTYAHQLTDGVQRDLNELSATNGLELVYCDWEPTEATHASSENLTTQIEVRKAASRALKAFVVMRDTASVNKPLLDSYATAAWDYRRWQWQLGSLYFPQQPVVASADGTGADNTTANSIPESYKHTLISMGTYKGGSTPCSGIPMRETANFLEQTGATSILGTGVTLTPFRQEAVTLKNTFPASNNGKWGTFSHGMSVLGVLLERTDLFNLSGVPINNARILSFRSTHESVSGTPIARTMTVFLKYVRLARVFLNNVEVEQ